MINRINQGSFKVPNEIGGSIEKNETQNVSPVYNSYSVSVTANTNADADEIANKTIMKIKQLQGNQIRSSRV